MHFPFQDATEKTKLSQPTLYFLVRLIFILKAKFNIFTTPIKIFSVVRSLYCLMMLDFPLLLFF